MALCQLTLNEQGERSSWSLARILSCISCEQVTAGVGDELLVAPDDKATMFYEAEVRRPRFVLQRGVAAAAAPFCETSLS